MTPVVPNEIVACRFDVAVLWQRKGDGWLLLIIATGPVGDVKRTLAGGNMAYCSVRAWLGRDEVIG